MGSINTTLVVADVAATLRFYTEVLGFKEEFCWGQPVLEGAGVLLYGHSVIFSRGAGGPPQPGIGLYINLDGQIEELYERLKAQTTVVAELQRKPWGDRTFAICDPDGYRIEFSQK